MVKSRKEMICLFTEAMSIIAENPDKEAAHEQADELIMKELKSLGYEEGVDIFQKMVRWCA